MSRWAIVLAGGSGTRFWPVSTPQHPKQFLSLTGETPLLRVAVDRLAGLVDQQRILIVTGERYADRTRQLLPDIPAEHVLAEPLAASTGPALTWATHFIRRQDPRATIMSVHADWHVGDDEAFRQDATTAISVAEQHDVLVTIGIVPTRPDPGYGYIVPGDALSDHARHVDRFVEKPSKQVAETLIESGGLWNCGFFAWTADRFFSETKSHAAEIAPFVDDLEGGDVSSFFHHVTAIAIDKSHFERSRRIAVVPASFQWDDVGAWAALARVRATDDNGNVKLGHVQTQDSRECIVWSPDDRIALFGVEGLVVARAHGVTLVTTKDKAAALKEFVESLPAEWREP